MGCHQAVVTQWAGFIVQQQALHQQWRLTQFIGEVMKHQYLTAQTQIAQFKAVGKT